MADRDVGQPLLGPFGGLVLIGVVILLGMGLWYSPRYAHWLRVYGACVDQLSASDNLGEALTRRIDCGKLANEVVLR
jgi:hypothetical protein